MQTPWGDIPVSDSHIHFFSEHFFTLLAKQKPGLDPASLGPILGWDMPPANPADLAARWVDELDNAGLNRAAIISSLPGDEVSVEVAVRAFPHRFYGYFMVNPHAPHAVQHVRDGLAAGNLHVPCLFPAMHGYSLHDPASVAIFEAAAASPIAVIFVHCGVLSVGVRKKLGLPSPFDLRFSNPIDLHHLALRFPHLRFVIPHFGAGYFRETLMLADLCPNIYLDTSSTNSWIRYQPAEWTLPKVLRRTLDIIGPHRLLFGSDSSYFPRGWNRSILQTQVEALAGIGVSAPDAASILGGNLLQLLGHR